jgi:hypothetical protein
MHLLIDSAEGWERVGVYLPTIAFSVSDGNC